MRFVCRLLKHPFIILNLDFFAKHSQMNSLTSKILFNSCLFVITSSELVKRYCRQIISSQGRWNRGPWGPCAPPDWVITSIKTQKTFYLFFRIFNLPPALLLRIATIKSGELLQDRGRTSVLRSTKVYLSTFLR
jgi:hypothetical protein